MRSDETRLRFLECHFLANKIKFKRHPNYILGKSMSITSGNYLSRIHHPALKTRSVSVGKSRFGLKLVDNLSRGETLEP